MVTSERSPSLNPPAFSSYTVPLSSWGAGGRECLGGQAASQGQPTAILNNERLVLIDIHIDTHLCKVCADKNNDNKLHNLEGDF